MANDVNCKHYDEENGWCKKLSDWSDPMPTIVFCPESPCKDYEESGSMTDNDIIKALGYCFAVGDCEHCVYADKPCQELMADALKLINRLKSEIEEQDQAIINALHHMKVVRVEAAKEIAKRLKEGCGRVKTEGKTMLVFSESAFDYIVKEMTEGEDESDFEM